MKKTWDSSVGGHAKQMPWPWLQTIQSTLAFDKALDYTLTHHGTSSRNPASSVSKYVLSCHPSPDQYLTADKKYFKTPPTIRHYLYSDIEEQCITALDSQHVKTVR